MPSAGQPLKWIPAGPLTGRTVNIADSDVHNRSLWNQYVVLGRLIGSGAYGVVYEGLSFDRVTNSAGSRVAVKVHCRSKVGLSAAEMVDLAERVDEEIRVQLLLQRHPSVVKLLAVGSLSPLQQPPTAAVSSNAAATTPSAAAVSGSSRSAFRAAQDTAHAAASDAPHSSDAEAHSTCTVMELAQTRGRGAAGDAQLGAHVERHPFRQAGA
jgi:hypothetical protein